MEAERAQADPGNSAPADREAEAARQHAADEREHKADARQRRADERERVADERERRADERERVANERERQADQRERQADEREHKAEERQREVDEREHIVDDRVRAAGTDRDVRDQRTLEAIDRARELLALSAERLHRQEAAVERDLSGRARDEAEIGRASAEGERGMAGALPDPGKLIERSKASRKQAELALREVAIAEGEIARVYEELAASSPDRREEYRAAAETHFETARKARDILRIFTE